ncbi:MAG: hypothetical protein KGH49_00930 [Candidatus Micrarchaeota archaeon]|nr:hypothetical protein [Candidatus Micrarchaeota archaeon]
MNDANKVKNITSVAETHKRDFKRELRNGLIKIGISAAIVPFAIKGFQAGAELDGNYNHAKDALMSKVYQVIYSGLLHKDVGMTNAVNVLTNNGIDGNAILSPIANATVLANDAMGKITDVISSYDTPQGVSDLASQFNTPALQYIWSKTGEYLMQHAMLDNTGGGLFGGALAGVFTAVGIGIWSKWNFEKASGFFKDWRKAIKELKGQARQ